VIITKLAITSSRFCFAVCLLISSSLAVPLTLRAQNKSGKRNANRVQIIHADSIVGGKINGKPIQKILGNVHLKTKKMDMYADSAYKFTGQKKVKAFGNIEIDTPKQYIWADTLTYYTNIDFSKLRGQVIIQSDSTTLFSQSVNYRFKNKVAHFLHKIRLKDPKGVLTANTGFYFRKPDSAIFRGNVQMRDSLRYIEGDTLYSNRRRGYYELHGDVYAKDPANNSRLEGDYLQSDSSGRRLVKGHAWLENIRKSSKDTTKSRADSTGPTPADTMILKRQDSLQNIARNSNPAVRPDTAKKYSSKPDTSQKQTSRPDTTHIHAAKILSIQHRTKTDTTTTVKAYKNVRIWSTDFSAVSDTAKYESKTHTFEIRSNAKAWHKHIQLTGPYIRVKLQNGDIKRLISYPNPFTVQQDTSIDRLNQIKGDTLRATFKNGQLSLIRVGHHSHLLRYTSKNGKPDGMIELQAPVTKIYFENGKLIKLKSLGKNSGNYLPDTKKTAKKRLKGFVWTPKKRPQRPKEKMKRRLPPISKNPPFKLPKRYLKYLKQQSESKPKAKQDTTKTPVKH